VCVCVCVCVCWQPEKIKELADNPEVLQIQQDPKMQEIIKVSPIH
jgi:hypothetical protein